MTTPQPPPTTTAASLRRIAADLREFRRWPITWTDGVRELERMAQALRCLYDSEGTYKDLKRLSKNLIAAKSLLVHSPSACHGYIDGVIGEVELVASRMEKRERGEG